MGSSGSTDTSSQQQNISQTQLPPWVNQAAQQNYALAQSIANRPLTQFSGQQVADIGPQTQQAWNLAATSGGAGSDQYNAAQAGYLTAAGTPATQVTPQSLGALSAQTQYGAPSNLTNVGSSMPWGATTSNLSGMPQSNAGLGAYMNPFTSSVIQNTLPLMQQQNALSQNQAANQANSANAFGGSRQGVQQGVAQAQGALNIGQMAANLNSQNFQQAQAAATGDISRNLQAQQGNQQANQANINSLLAASTGLGGLGTQAQTNQRQQFLEQSTAGAQQQQQAQNQINAQMGQFNQAQAYPTQQLSTLMQALGMSPYGSTTMGSSTGQSQTTTTPSLLSDVQSGLQGLGSMVGAGGPLAGMFSSDRHLKTDIAKVGVHAPTGLPMYSFRYKGDPKSYPKITGPMAEDAMQVAPHAVQTVGVHAPTGQALHTVNMAALNAAGPPMGANDNMAGPAIRPKRMPGANGAFATRVPGPLAPPTPMGLNGAMGATMRPPRMRPQARMPRVVGGMSV